MTAETESTTEFTSFKEFYPFYLNEHSDATCRTLHFVGSWLVLAVIAMSIYLGNYALLCLIPVVGDGVAWVGHFFYEHNKPATFSYPVYSLMGDWVMFKDILVGKVKLS